jgi:hypothetical protein
MLHRHLPPDFRWRRICDALSAEQATPEMLQDPIVDRVYTVIKNSNATETAVWDAVELISDQEYREYLTAYFLSNATDMDISITMGIRLEAVILFRQLVIDLTQLEHRMAFKRFAETFSKQAKFENTKALVSMAIGVGPESQRFYWADAQANLQINPKKLAGRLATIAFFKAVAAQNVPIGSKTASEAMKWTTVVRQQLEAHQNFEDDVDQTIGAFEAIEAFDATQTAEEAGIQDISNIIH